MPGGGGGGGGDTMQTSKSNGEQVTGPNPYLAPQLQKIGNAAFDWTNQNMTAPGYFPGGTVAARGPADLSARDSTQGWATKFINNADSSFNPAVSYLSDAAGGKYLDPANNPQLKGYLDAMFRPQTENFLDTIAPTIDSKFAGSGRTAGGAHFDTTMRGVNDLGRAQADATAKLYMDERGLQANAAGMLPGVLGAKSGMVGNWLDVLNSVGAADNAQAQRQLDDQNAQYSYDKTGQLDWYNRLSQTLQGMYPGGQQIGWQTGNSTGSGGGGGGGGGGQGMQLAGAGIAAAGSIAAAFI